MHQKCGVIQVKLCSLYLEDYGCENPHTLDEFRASFPGRMRLVYWNRGLITSPVHSLAEMNRLSCGLWCHCLSVHDSESDVSIERLAVCSTPAPIGGLELLS